MFDATIRFTEALGAETLIHLRNHNEEDLIIRLVSVEQPPEPGVVTGVDSEADYVFLFDGEGKRLHTGLDV